MSEAERIEAIKAVQLELFTLEAEYRFRRQELKRKMILIKCAGVKRCRACREEMNLEQFYDDIRYADGKYPYCRECKRTKAWRAA